MSDLKRHGKIRFVGVSIWKPEEGLEIIKHNYDVDTFQLIYNILCLESEKEIFSETKKNNIGIIARSPIYYGLLSGKYHRQTLFANDDFRTIFFKEDDLKMIETLLEELKKVAPKKNFITLALQFVLANENISTTIPGARNSEQVKQNCAVSDDEPLNENLISKIRDLSNRLSLRRKII